MDPDPRSPARGAGSPGTVNPDREDAGIGPRDHAVWVHPAGRALASVVTRTRTWVGANVALTATLLVASVLVFAANAAAGEVYEMVEAGDGLALLDHPVLAAAKQLRTPALDSAIAFFSNTGGPVLQPIVTGVVVVWLSWRWRSWTPLVLTTLAGGGALLMTVLGKRLSGRARPDLVDSIPPYEYSASFPSGHALNASVIAGILCYLMLHRFRTHLVRSVWVVVFVVYALAMGLSRVYLGHHWLTDVLAAWLFALAWLGVVVTLHRLWLTARAKHGDQRWTAMLKPSPPASGP